MTTMKDEADLGKITKKKQSEKITQQGMHPGVAAAIGAVVGAAGGVAVAIASQNPEIRKKAKEQFTILSKKATNAWDQLNSPEGKKALKSSAKEAMDSMEENLPGETKEVKSPSKRSVKTDLK